MIRFKGRFTLEDELACVELILFIRLILQAKLEEVLTRVHWFFVEGLYWLALSHDLFLVVLE